MVEINVPVGEVKGIGGVREEVDLLPEMSPVPSVSEIVDLIVSGNVGSSMGFLLNGDWRLPDRGARRQVISIFKGDFEN